MDEQLRAQQLKDSLQSFLGMFNEYAQEVFGEHRQDHLDKLRTNLQLLEPKVTHIIVTVLGNITVVLGTSSDLLRSISLRYLIPTALLGDNNELTLNFSKYNSSVTNMLNRALGTIEAGLWPPKEPTPVLVIRDDELRQRCSDLLSAPGNYDRVIREATTVLEDRIRNKCPHDVLSRLIPQSADQAGENLVNKIFSPDNPVLSISSDKSKRIAFHKIVVGVFAYLRNPYHHSLDPNTEWSWAWSTIGFIDRLLSDIDSCVVA